MTELLSGRIEALIIQLEGREEGTSEKLRAKRKWIETLPRKAKNFPPLKNDNLLRAIRGEKVDRIPIWVHRQAGRYMKEFRDLRKQHDFFTICRNPKLVCEVTLQPIDAFDLDASIIFCDILVILQALGIEVQMVKGVGPWVPNPLKFPDDKDLSRLNHNVDVYKELGYVFEGISLTRHALQGKVPLIGFTGAPWTLFVYMICGKGTSGKKGKTWKEAISWLYKYPKLSHKVFDLITETNIKYLVGQVKAGAQVLEVFDSWIGILSPKLFQDFALRYDTKICKEVKRRCKKELGIDIPMTLFAKGANQYLEQLSKSGYDTISIDWCIESKKARKRVQLNCCLQGNLDPCFLYASEKDLREEVKKMLNGFGPTKTIANLGHGMFPDHDPEKLAIFIDAVHSHTSFL